MLVQITIIIAKQASKSIGPMAARHSMRLFTLEVSVMVAWEPAVRGLWLPLLCMQSCCAT